MEGESDEFKQRGTGVRRRAGQPLRPRRRPARRLPRRTAREVPRPYLGPGPLARAVRRNHRRDRRVRAAGALPVGRGLPGPGGRRLRPHPGPGGHLAEQHHLPGHRCRVRRQAHRAALAGARTRRRTGRAGLVRAGQAAGLRGARRTRGPAAGPRGRARPPGRRDPARRTGLRTRGERGRGPGGHEPLRRGPAADAVPAADDGAHRHLQGRGLPGAPGRGLRAVRGRRGRAGRVRGEAHGLAGGGAGVPGRGDRTRAVRRDRAVPARSTPAPAARSSTTPPSPRRSSAGCGPPSPRPACGRSWRRTGCCSTPSCCPGR